MTTVRFDSESDVMLEAIRAGMKGIGCVEPNPPVGAVIVDDELNLIAIGHHREFGEAHAEIEAINSAGQTTGQQLFVTLEPCSHHGKTPPCADAVIAAGFRRVVVGCEDPAEHVAGQGIARLRNAGIAVEVGLCQEEAEDLVAPFRKLQIEKRPWVHAKWAMTLDGHIATRTGHSQWISNEQSREHVHVLRGRMDAIIAGSGTVRHDNPTLTARPAGPRMALRVILCSTGTSVGVNSNLIKTINEAGLLICVQKSSADFAHLSALEQMGAEVLVTEGTASDRIHQVLEELGCRSFTNVLLESGPGLLGSFFDEHLIDEVSVFIAPKLCGGSESRSPIGGMGLSEMPSGSTLKNITTKHYQDNVLIHGRTA